MDCLLRPFAKSDYSSVAALWGRTQGLFFSEADEEDSIARFLDRNRETSFVAERGEEILGTILCGHDGRFGYLYHLAVSTKARRSGLGALLVRKGVEALAAAGITKCHWMTLKNNGDGLEFFSAIEARQRNELVLFTLFPADLRGGQPAANSNYPNP